MWNVNSTSSGPNGCPSAHFTPSRMLKVYVRWSGETLQSEARTPTTFCCESTDVSPW